MHQLFCVLTIAVFTAAALPSQSCGHQASQEPEKPIIELWPLGLPADAKPVSDEIIADRKKKQTDERLTYVQTPSLTVYQPPQEKSNRCAMIICPGGGYNILAWPKEGLELAEYLNTHGVTAFVLKYRVPRRDPSRCHWEPMQDVQRAIRLVRSQSENWKIDPDRIGVMGFSAGGHLTVMAGTQYDTKSYPRVDAADDISCRPDFICPIYAAYLGPKYNDAKAKLSTELKITKDTPPTFLAVTSDDKMRGAQSALLFARLCELKVPTEIHVYTKGGHCYGIRTNENPVGTWHHRMTDWLKSQGYLENR